MALDSRDVMMHLDRLCHLLKEEHMCTGHIMRVTKQLGRNTFCRILLMMYFHLFVVANGLSISACNRLHQLDLPLTAFHLNHQDLVCILSYLASVIIYIHYQTSYKSTNLVLLQKFGFIIYSGYSWRTSSYYLGWDYFPF